MEAVHRPRRRSWRTTPSGRGPARRGRRATGPPRWLRHRRRSGPRQARGRSWSGRLNHDPAGSAAGRPSLVTRIEVSICINSRRWPPPPHRRAACPRAERERQILDVAHARFARDGYANVTMDGVAAEVGVTKPLLYAYWGNKERIYLACLERDAQRLLETVGDAVGSAPRPGRRHRGRPALVLRLRRPASAAPSGCCSTRRCRRGGQIAQRVHEHREQIVALVATTLLAELPAARAQEGARGGRGAVHRRARRRRGAGPLVAAHRRADPRGGRRRALDRDGGPRPPRTHRFPRTRRPDNERRPQGRRPRRQPDPVRALEQRLRERLQPGHAQRRARRPDRALRARRASASARWSPAPCSSTAATSTSRARPCWAAGWRPRPPPTTSGRPAAPVSRPRSPWPTRSPWARSTPAWPAASTPPPTRRSP